MEKVPEQFAWRTPTGEKNKLLRKKMSIENKKNISNYSCNWYYCADENMENEKVLVYSVEKTSELKNTGIFHEDRFLQKKTSTGKPCSGKIKKFANIALPGTYNQDGTII